MVAFSPGQFNAHPSTRSDDVAQTGLELKTFMPQPLGCRDCSYDYHASHFMTLPWYLFLPALELVIYARG